LLILIELLTRLATQEPVNIVSMQRATGSSAEKEEAPGLEMVNCEGGTRIRIKLLQCHCALQKSSTIRQIRASPSPRRFIVPPLSNLNASPRQRLRLGSFPTALVHMIGRRNRTTHKTEWQVLYDVGVMYERQNCTRRCIRC